jgi:hypothetical protein
MAVYIGTRKYKYGRWVLSHMVADTLEELHKAAQWAGLDKKWFQDKPKRPHYDICQIRKELAIRHGAILVNDRVLITILKDKYGE